MSLLGTRATGARGYAPVNGLKMYYEIEGAGDPLVYLLPAFGLAGLRSFAALTRSYSVVTADFQGHGRTADIPERPLTLEQNAEDVIGLLKYLGISKAHFFGESYGGVVATMLAVHHPEIVDRVATYAATFGPSEVAHNREMLRFSAVPTPESRCFEFQRKAYKKVAPYPDYWPKFCDKVFSLQWGGFAKKELTSIEVPFLIALGDHDFVRVEHALETYRLIAYAELAVIPDAGHFALFSEPNRVVPVVDHFLKKPEKRMPIATAEMGYHFDETR